MLIPPGIGKHKELSTSYTKFDFLLQDLLKNRFSGYLKLSFWGFEGVLILDMGRIIQAYSSEQDNYLIGEPSVLRILHKAEENDGGIEVYQLLSEITISLGFAIRAEPYQNLKNAKGSDFSNVLNTIENKSLTGYLDLQFSGKRGIATIYFLEGTPVESIVMSSNGNLVSGEKLFDKIAETSNLIQTIEVYSTSDSDPLISESAFIIPWAHQKYFNFWKEFLHYLDTLLERKLKRQTFFELLKLERLNLSNEYPFLYPEINKIKISNGIFEIQNIMCHGEFLRAFVQLHKNIFTEIPPRKLKKIEFSKVISESKEIAKKNYLDSQQFDPERFILKVLDGIIK